MLNAGRQLSGTSAPGNKGVAAVGAKPSDPEVDGLVKKGQATKDPMEEENAKAKKEGEALKVKPESNTVKVLARGLK